MSKPNSPAHTNHRLSWPNNSRPKRTAISGKMTTGKTMRNAAAAYTRGNARETL
jgi:hypothetical protein